MIEKKQNDKMKQFLQKQPHRITMAKHNLGIHQLRIMARIVEKLQPEMILNSDEPCMYKENKEVSIKVAELVKAGNVKPLREALKSLMKKVVIVMHYIEEEAVFREIGTTLIQAYDYKHGSDFVKVEISKHLMPQFVDLARGYTKYKVDVAFKTSSPNAFKLYQFFSHFRDKKQIQCNVDTLKKWLQIDKKYQKPAHIVQHILEPAIKELKEIADVWFTIAERVTEGRKMKGWKFNIHTKKEARKKNKPMPQKSPLTTPKAEKSQENISKESRNKAISSWDICLDTIKENISAKDFDTWFKPIKPHKYDQDELTILVPSEFFADWLKKNYAQLLQKAAGFLGDDLKIEIVVETTEQLKPLKKKQAGSIRGVLENDFLLREDNINKIVHYIENSETSLSDSEICKKTILKMAAWVKNNDKIGAPDKLIMKSLSEKFGIKF